MRLDLIDGFPAALDGLSARDVRDVLPNPTLIEIEGERAEPLFVSTLLHGDETSSFRILQRLQAAYGGTRPPRSLLILVGNVDAAAEGKRFLEGQPDFNRIWTKGAGAHHGFAEEVLRVARERRVFASIDVHNNTGRNPIYACVNVLRPADLQLAAIFAPVGVYYLNPSTTQSIAFSRLCPAVTLECGRSEEAEGVEAAWRLVEAALRIETFENAPPADDALKLYETVARLVVDQDCSVSFDESDKDSDLVLRSDLENSNFVDLQAGVEWGRVRGGGMPLKAVDERGRDLTAGFFRIDGDAIVQAAAGTPSMITTNVAAIRQDCLGYLMRSI